MARRGGLSGQLAITLAASEMVPFAKTGGLADVSGTLAAALARRRVKVNAVLPAYHSILADYIASGKTHRVVDFAEIGVDGQIYRLRLSPNLDVYFVRADRFFDRPGYYSENGSDYTDNAERFAFFSRAVLEVASITGSRIVHLNDWQAATGAAFLKLDAGRYPQLAKTKSVLTVHNLAYQGIFDYSHWPALGLPQSYFCAGQFEYYGQVNFLKAGLVDADVLTTVSPTYAAEITRNGCGFGLEGVLRERAASLCGILNGIDEATWDPGTDRYLARHFWRNDLPGKAACKRRLQQLYGLKVSPEIPVFCAVTRLAEGKGLELIMAAGDALMQRGLQFVLLGSGDNRYANYFSELASRYPGRAGVKITFDEALAHATIAGADALLMPSEREPCGLTALYALRYGTVPVARRTGGLADAIEPYERAGNGGNGLLFDDYSGDALLETIDKAIKLYADKDAWLRLMRRGMAADHSWNTAAGQYLGLYRRLLGQD